MDREPPPSRINPAGFDRPVYSFVRNSLGAFRVLRETSHAHGVARVWEVETDAGARYFVKQHQQPRRFRQEVRFYQRWIAPIAHAAPSLMAASHEAVSTVILSKVEGEPAEASDRMVIDERRLFKQAGRLLRALHEQPLHDDDSQPLDRAMRMRLDATTERAEGIVHAETIERVRAIVGKSDALREASRVPCHRDYLPRNWLLSPVPDTRDVFNFGIIDFDHGRPDARVADFAPLFQAVDPDRTDLLDAFFDGYGRPLTNSEQCQLRHLALIHALGTIIWGHVRQQPELEAQGRRALARELDGA